MLHTEARVLLALHVSSFLTQCSVSLSRHAQIKFVITWLVSCPVVTSDWFQSCLHFPPYFDLTLHPEVCHAVQQCALPDKLVACNGDLTWINAKRELKLESIFKSAFKHNASFHHICM